jgi:peptide deformylase
MSKLPKDIMVNLLLEDEGIGLQATNLEHLVRILTYQVSEKGKDLSGVLHIGEVKIESQDNTNDDQ